MTAVNLESVRDQVAILRWCKQQKAAIKELEDNARSHVEAAMGQATLGLLDDEPVITWSSFKENRFDSKAFREENPELWERYKARHSKRAFTVLDEKTADE